MRRLRAVGALAIALSMAGCGGKEQPEPEQQPMKVEDTAFGDLVGTQDKARDRANRAVDVHRKALEQRLGEDEGAPPGD